MWNSGNGERIHNWMTEHLDDAEGIDLVAASSAEYSTIKKIKPKQ